MDKTYLIYGDVFCIIVDILGNLSQTSPHHQTSTGNNGVADCGMKTIDCALR
ncbi:hypothetical protein GTQ43_23920 [Nostoc sp. KVJ3]|uniref:hypothetical protein n=1 Tax=Nostoc sp. KVJ3 TaxID=457945 RepID=UPI002237DD4D|nr:hypothetical protein [Nostoc sp. KVJ3]MCW5316751.1 hypothetical protein [Nostoc sp. KVJ3]